MGLPALGSPIEDIETPCLVLDLDPFERNIRSMSEYCRSNGVEWRPHSKCHKSIEIARRVVDAGAIGVTCAKLGEAEVMASGGVTDLLIANPLAGDKRLRRLVELRRIADPITLVDHIDHVTALSAATESGGVSIRTLIEVDIGMARCGTAPGEPTIELARAINEAPGLDLAGIMGYEGHLLRIPDPEEKERSIARAIALLADTKALFDRAGLPCPIVSAGGTGSYHYTARQPGVTEMQAGGGIFMDLFYRDECGISDLEIALKVHATVTSRPTKDRAIIDAGRKTLDHNIHMPEVASRDDVRFQSLSAEHGVLTVTHGAGPRIGERIEIILGYGDMTTMLHDHFCGVRNGKLEAIWPLDARGRLS